MTVLNERTRGLVDLSAVLASGTPGETAGGVASPEEIEECLLQAYLFLGFPTVLQAFAVWRALDGEPRSVHTERSDGSAWRQRGVRLCRRIYGRAYGKLRSNVRRLHPDLDRWMIEEGYGKVLCRPALDSATRELCIVSLLAVTGHLPQLHSHLRGALNVGADPNDVEETLAVALRRSPEEGHAAQIGRLWNRVLDQHHRADDHADAGREPRDASLDVH
jgi:4-carboxymuconolactone decarboxylase